MGAPASVRKVVTTAAGGSLFSLPAGTTIHVQPGSGGSMTVKVRVHADDVPINLDPLIASHTVAATYAILGPVAEVVCTATTANGAISAAF